MTPPTPILDTPAKPGQPETATVGTPRYAPPLVTLIAVTLFATTVAVPVAPVPTKLVKLTLCAAALQVPPAEMATETTFRFVTSAVAPLPAPPVIVRPVLGCRTPV